MANEATVRADFTFVKGDTDLTGPFQPGALNFTVAGTKYVSHVQALSDVEAALDMGSVTGPGWCWVRNLDDTDWIKISRATGETAFLKLNAGMVSVLHLDATGGAAPVAIADTGKTPELQYVILDA